MSDEMQATGLPPAYGLYDPKTEHDACGVGFVAHIKGVKSRDIVEQGLSVLARLAHRGACGADPETGDGAGILLQLPHRFFEQEALRRGFALPRRGRYGIGQIFLPQDAVARARCEQIFEEVIEAEGQRVLGWRDVPIDATHVGEVARRTLPVVRQVYVGFRRLPPSAFERKLYVIRKFAGKRIHESDAAGPGQFHVASLSSETIVYKGLLLPGQLPRFYPDLGHPEMISAIALVHSRFSTNTFPTWDLAQPFRYIAHNGEINTLQGNRNWMAARRSKLTSAKFDGGLDRLFPIIVTGRSDSAQFDNMLELLHLAGRSLPHAVTMMIPEAWQNDAQMSPQRRAFYEYHSALLEPWDGPAALVFSDGQIVGASLDRNGLRPARYVVTTDDRVILASEAGVVEVAPEQVRRKGRVQPGKMFIVDTDEGRILDDEEVKQDMVSRFPYARWLKKNVYDLMQLPASDLDGGERDASFAPEASTPARRFAASPTTRHQPTEGRELRTQQRAFGYSDEDIELLLIPMAQEGKEPIGSMGSDTPLAVLGDQAPTLSWYFHQLFAQVTNPAIDPLRERLVMNLSAELGPDGNSFEETPEHCHRIKLPGPILDEAALERIRRVHEGVFQPTTLSLLYELDSNEGVGGSSAEANDDALARATTRLCEQAVRAVDEGNNILVLSDRGVDARFAPIPALLALSAVHQHLVREGIRMEVGLLIETAEAREVHDFALLIGFGAGAVQPYLAFDTIGALVQEGRLEGPREAAIARYVKAVEDGLLKVMAKMGISTLQSYRGAQIFEAVGLDRSLIERHFTGTPSRLDGIGLTELGREVRERHARAFAKPGCLERHLLPAGGQYRWRRQGERHKWNPATIAKLQAAVRSDDEALYRDYAELVANEAGEPHTLRGLLELIEAKEPIPLDEVEPEEAILSRFVSGAMSFGSISAEAHETMAIAMNRLGARSNSGEGGEEPERFEPDADGSLRRSAIKQVASGRFGVTAHYLVNADDLQIKVAQGAKPGEGGQLPGHKVDERIARVRCSTPGVSLISPPPHHDIYSIEDLAQLIYDLRAVNPAARVSVKLVSEVGVGTVAAGVAKTRAQAVVIAGAEGGTGASPLSSLKHAGLPWELGLAEAQQVLVQTNLRRHVRLQVDGGLRSGRDVLIAALLGAEEFGIATAALIASGCLMLRKCHENSCNVGIATQRPELRARFTGRPEHIERLFRYVVREVREGLARLGLRSIDEAVGRVDLLRQRRDVGHWKAKRLDLSSLIAAGRGPAEWPRRCTEPWYHALESHPDTALLELLEPALAGGPPQRVERPMDNRQRAAGARLSGEIARRHGAAGLPDGTIHLNHRGSAGQSYGAFLAQGLTLELSGEANDYLGKGLSGGRIIVYPPAGSRFVAEENVIVGNTALYGATAGEVFLRGLAGERFAVRNSGARAVVEGVGDHGCEYMTGGVVVILGPTGRNFAAGMSGGTAYVFDRGRKLRERANIDTVELEGMVDESDIWLVYGLIEDHVRYTASALGARILDNWETMVPHFVKVMPTEYKAVLQRRRSSLRPPGARDRRKGAA